MDDRHAHDSDAADAVPPAGLPGSGGAGPVGAGAGRAGAGGVGRGGLLGGDDLAGRLVRWAAEARVEDAARQRTRERWLRQQAEEEASLLGVLSDLAERGAPVVVRTRAGRQHRGVVLVVGDDFVAVAPPAPGPPAPSSSPPHSSSPSGGGTVVALAAVSSVRVPAGVAATGDRAVRTRLRLAEVLAGLAAERERALIVPLGGEETVAGHVRSVGVDVVVVRLDGPEPATAYVAIDAVGEIVLDPA